MIVSEETQRYIQVSKVFSLHLNRKFQPCFDIWFLGFRTLWRIQNWGIKGFYQNINLFCSDSSEIKLPLSIQFTWPSSISLCNPDLSCSELLVLRIERLWDFRFCLAWRAVAQLPLSVGITSKQSLSNNCKDKLKPSIKYYNLIYVRNYFLSSKCKGNI